MPIMIVRRGLLACLLLIPLTGCADQIDLETATVPLALGMDLDEEGRFHYFTSEPIFSSKLKKTSHESSGTSTTLRQSRERQDSQILGLTLGRNFQVTIIGKRMMQHKGWFKMMDVLYRDARNTLTDRMIMFDGPVSELFALDQPDQPMMPVLLRGMVINKSSRSETANTSVQQLHRQMYETGITPYVSEITVSNKKIYMAGTALMDSKGIYVESLNTTESILLAVLQRTANPGISLTFQIPGVEKQPPFVSNSVSISPGKISTKIKTSYENGKFNFHIKVKTNVSLTEHLFPFDVFKEKKELEKKINEQMTKKLTALVHKIQKKKSRSNRAWPLCPRP